MAEEHNALKYGPTISRAGSIAAGGGYGDVGISRLSETLQPNIDLWSRPEWALLRDERIWMVNPSIGGTALETSIVGVFNQVGSGLIVVVQKVLYTSSVLSEFTVRHGANVVFDATSNPNSRDSRRRVDTSVRCGSFAHSQVGAIGFTMLTARRAQNTSEWLDLDIVLAPGFFCGLADTTAGVAVAASFMGYERVAFPGELTNLG